MDIIIFVVKRIIITTCSKVALTVHVELLFVRCKRPHSDVKLASFKQKRALYIFLNYPIRVNFFRGKEFLDVNQAVKYLYSSPLVHVCGFY